MCEMCVFLEILIYKNIHFKNPEKVIKRRSKISYSIQMSSSQKKKKKKIVSFVKNASNASRQETLMSHTLME